jgi:hypothetical protein
VSTHYPCGETPLPETLSEELRTKLVEAGFDVTSQNAQLSLRWNGRSADFILTRLDDEENTPDECDTCGWSSRLCTCRR